MPTVTPICTARGGITDTANFDENRIAASAQNEITKLNDLAELFNAQIAAGPLSDPTAFRISAALTSAQGATAFERYLSALASVCGASGQCSDFPEADKPKAQALLGLRRLSQPTFSRLVQLVESQQTGGLIQKIMTAVFNLVSEVATGLNLAQDQMSEQKINALIAQRCQAGFVPVVTPPVTPPPPPPSRPDIFAYGLDLTPSYGFLLYGDRNAPVESGPSLHGHAALGFHFNEKYALQIDYRAFLNVDNDFSSRLSQDFLALSGIFKVKDITIIPQLSFLWENDVLSNKEQLLGAVGGGVSLFDGLLYPFAGAIFGTEYGGYAGARSSYLWKGPKIGLAGQLLYSYAGAHQLGASVTGEWRPVCFWRACLQVGVAVGTTYDISENAVGLNLGVFLGLTGNVLPTQPIRWGGF